MVDVCLKKKARDAYNKLMEINEFDFKVFGETPKQITFHVMEGVPRESGINVFVNSTDVIEFLSRLSLSHMVNDIDVYVTAGRFLITINIGVTEDHTTNIDIDFLEQIKDMIDLIGEFDNGKEQ